MGRMHVETRITQLQYNWRQTGRAGGVYGESFDFYVVGRDGVAEIVNAIPDCDSGYTGNDFYNVLFEDGSVETIYNPNKVVSQPVNHGES